LISAFLSLLSLLPNSLWAIAAPSSQHSMGHFSVPVVFVKTKIFYGPFNFCMGHLHRITKLYISNGPWPLNKINNERRHKILLISGKLVKIKPSVIPNLKSNCWFPLFCPYSVYCQTRYNAKIWLDRWCVPVVFVKTKIFYGPFNFCMVHLHRITKLYISNGPWPLLFPITVCCNMKFLLSWSLNKRVINPMTKSH
jgi:hypothetical protein